jgi:hypothetical protein
VGPLLRARVTKPPESPETVPLMLKVGGSGVQAGADVEPLHVPPRPAVVLHVVPFVSPPMVVQAPSLQSSSAQGIDGLGVFAHVHRASQLATHF